MRLTMHMIFRQDLITDSISFPLMSRAIHNLQVQNTNNNKSKKVTTEFKKAPTMNSISISITKPNQKQNNNHNNNNQINQHKVVVIYLISWVLQHNLNNNSKIQVKTLWISSMTQISESHKFNSSNNNSNSNSPKPNKTMENQITYLDLDNRVNNLNSNKCSRQLFLNSNNYYSQDNNNSNNKKSKSKQKTNRSLYLI